ncbi:phage head-tail connector protein [Prauserella endophytica]|uniref:Phage head-tail connector protein n=1 Tax=Prauserella endophytica TaxID=1592324 RepID=A0ABY2RSU4_9PSEU|nr:phage head-tail connector protein [Prauserella endophytica]TKG58893.1 phage head-tail connector protein [Prauserella endophytica]
MAIVTLAEAKTQVGIAPTDTSKDAVLMNYVDAIASTVENYKLEIVEAREFTEERVLNGGSFVLANSPVLSLISVETVDGTTVWDVNNLHVSRAGVVRVMSGASVSGTVAVTYRAGYETVPENYKRGALVILQHVWETQRGVGQVGTGVIGQEEGTYGQLSTYSLPRKALEWLGVPNPVVM